MFELAQEHDFAIGSLRICGIYKSIKVFLECFDLFCVFVHDLPNMPIGSASYFPYYLVLLKNMWFDFFAHQLCLMMVIIIITD